MNPGHCKFGRLAIKPFTVRHGRTGMEHHAGVLLGRGIYSLPEASRLTRISAARLRRWLCGYDFIHAGKRHHSDRVIEGELPLMDETLALSFLDLQEARCLNEFRRRRVGWVTLREAHEKAKYELGTRHPFATGKFKTVGRRIMLDSANEEGDKILMDLVKDQLTFREVLRPYLRGLEFLENVPVLWFPLEGSRRVVIDPQRAFGHPIVSRRGVPTSTLARAYRAERSFDKVARWYEVDLRSVRDAVRFENDLAA
jgi:uncharacterized protein (DUF433 family)